MTIQGKKDFIKVNTAFRNWRQSFWINKLIG